jgi:asparagine synthase (glutamine-hydrolysing)
MCGIAGFLSAEVDGQIALAMANELIHRGPDDSGVWCNETSGVALAHRRLSILDTSPEGRQPMVSASGRYVIAFNGEIYNHLALRGELESMSCGPSLAMTGTRAGWRGHSDTETLLAGIEAWGVEATLLKSIGMFAFALWDTQLFTLSLARDRLGEKPLYYGWQGSGRTATFLFGSQVKALRAHPIFRSKIDRGALSLLLRHGSIPAPFSIYEGIAKLLPGCLLTVSLQLPVPQLVTYWSGSQAAINGVANTFGGTPIQAVDALEVLMNDAVHMQMMADVPVGAFLSGGVDSSTVVALMQAQSARQVKTFTVGFDEEGYNEASHAKAVANHLGTEHTEMHVTPDEAMAVIPHLPFLYDEPFADASQIPTFLVSQLARQHVTVSLSGDAGDELFCGYNRYHMTANLWRKITVLPISFRKLLAQSITSVSPKRWDRLATLLPPSVGGVNFGDKLHKGANVLARNSAEALYSGLVSHWDDPATVVIGGLERETLLTSNMPKLPGLDPVQRMMALDMLTYLPDDVLTKVDRAAMGVSLESRVPFLDHRVVEFAWSLPQSMKLRDGQTKWVLRQVLYRHVPKGLIERPKMGFGVPLDNWLRGPLRDWAETLLDEARLRQEGYFHPLPIRLKWSEHLSGQRNWASHLWSVLMFQAWLEVSSR